MGEPTAKLRHLYQGTGTTYQLRPPLTPPHPFYTQLRSPKFISVSFWWRGNPVWFAGAVRLKEVCGFRDPATDLKS